MKLHGLGAVRCAGRIHLNLFLLRVIRVVRAIRGSFLGSIRTIHELHEVKTKRVDSTSEAKPMHFLLPVAD